MSKVYISNDEPHEAVVVISEGEKRTHDGVAFEADILKKGVVNGGFVRIVLKAVDKLMHVVFEIDTDDKVYFDTFGDSTYTDQGTPVNTFNRILGSDNVPTGEVYADAVVDVYGADRSERHIPAGGRTGGGGDESSESIILPGHNMLIEIQNGSTTSQDIGTAINWYEE